MISIWYSICEYGDLHTSPGFRVPALERIRGVVGRIRLMWLPATVGTASVN
jgi:hypothetical protein